MKRYPSSQKFTAVINLEGEYSTMWFSADTGTKNGKNLKTFLHQEAQIQFHTNNVLEMGEADDDWVKEFTNIKSRKGKVDYLNSTGVMFDVCAVFTGHLVEY